VEFAVYRYGTIAITNAKNNETARLPLEKQAIELRIGYVFTNPKDKP